MRFGLHTGQQECSLEDLVAVWRLAEEVGFDSIFTSDHFYPIPRGDGSAVCYEPVATLTALALETTRVRIGCLVWAVGFRSPGVVAKAVATIDAWSNGRVELGLGTGAMEAEYTAFGYDFPSARTRLDQLEEACVVVPGLLRNERFTYRGRHFRVDNASLTPRPVQERVPLWIGGKGMQRLVPIAARYADVYNGNNMTPEEYGTRIRRLDECLTTEGRQPGDVGRAINVGFYMGATARDADAYRRQVDASYLRPDEVLLGTVDEVVEQVAAYRAAGAQQVNLNVFGNRPPFDSDAIARFAADVIPQFRIRSSPTP
ncbi:MAG: LLM class flavin-dependent oxidoreductase [bacterium]|nr:LLM class flavin-dependent oxidoreductase [bacterium]